MSIWVYGRTCCPPLWYLVPALEDVLFNKVDFSECLKLMEGNAAQRALQWSYFLDHHQTARPMEMPSSRLALPIDQALTL